MRIQFKASDLVRGAEVAQSVANPQSTIAAFSTILMTAEHNNLVTLAAVDYDVRVRVDVPAEVETKGKITVPARTFYDLVRELSPDADVIVEATDERVKVRCGSTDCEMASINPEDFPVWPEMEPTLEFDIPQKELKAVLDRVLLAVPVRDTRKALLGALFEVQKSTLSVVGTDGKILACIRQAISAEKSPKDFKGIVPRKLLEELNRHLSDQGAARVAFNDKQVSFQLGNIFYVSNQVEGKYPDYQQVIPKQFARRFCIQKPPLLTSIKRAAIFADQRQSSVILSFKTDEPGQNQYVTILADSPEKGRFRDKLPAVVEGGNFRIAFNYKFLQDVLKVLPGEEVVLQANQNSTPAIWKSTSTDDCFYVIMPVKIVEQVEEEESLEEATE